MIPSAQAAQRDDPRRGHLTGEEISEAGNEEGWCRVKHSALIATVLLALAACTPERSLNSDGATCRHARPRRPSRTMDRSPEEDWPATAALLPGVFDVTLPAGALVVKDCRRRSSRRSQVSKPPSMACVADLGLGAPPPAEVDSQFLNAREAAGWKPVRATAAERYFERAKGQTDCADVAVLTVLEGKTLCLRARPPQTRRRRRPMRPGAAILSRPPRTKPAALTA